MPISYYIRDPSMLSLVRHPTYYFYCLVSHNIVVRKYQNKYKHKDLSTLVVGDTNISVRDVTNEFMQNRQNFLTV